MSLVSFIHRNITHLSPEVVSAVQSRAATTGGAQIRICGTNYSVHPVRQLGGFCVQPTGGGGLLNRLFGTQRTVAVLERQLNQNINPVKAHNEYVERTFGSRL
ncbi:hypothetical protein [Escherichia albertii]|uniref:hypothetical protein n=1 Tax=Escherichia albertii TaxID=208962 RepID=UPI000BF5B336|nr:hypothetical protein [Escherichia albertii]EEW0112477.1 hypothetical protein [Escherichia albertii]EFB7458232.1 hypothetical protein [Escherichia albertii]EFO0966740.1 hypothetical protein [Escherichia albertii]EFO4719705.1 hypothetical protein [Escherichia albertii]MCE7716201.1 hypothetical protein [Escherichia albertii]